MTLNILAKRLTQYDEQEARSIVRLLLDDCFGWNYTDICCGALEMLSDDNAERLEVLMKRLEIGEPIQYVTGKAVFYGREFHVEPGVLIPRPETEKLIDLTKEAAQKSSLNILDIGTGSGCIAITLAKELDNSEVTAWDVSDDALRIAEINSKRLHANVRFKKQDTLNPPIEENSFDIIVSNPPYICNKEAAEMESNVLDNEPHIALFVPDDDPLLFYKKITIFSSKALKEDGILAFEINPIYEKEMKVLVEHYFTDVIIHQDQFGKARCLLAHKRSLAEGQNG